MSAPTVRGAGLAALMGLVAPMGLVGCYEGGAEDAAGTEGADSGGTDGEMDDGSEDGGTAGPGDPGVPLCDVDASDVAGPRLLRRLTTQEIDASVRAVFSLSTQAWTGPALSPDPAASSGFTNDADRLRVTEAFAAALQTTATDVAAQVSEPSFVAQLVPCSAQGGVECAQTFVTSFGAALYRRPLTEAEVDRYLALYDTVAGDDDFEGFVYWATSTLLQSPNFIYRSELGDDDGDGGYTLSPYEIATALAYTFTGGPPDEALLNEAAAGGLQSSDEILDAANALALADDGKPRAGLRTRLHAFHRQWLGLSGLPNIEKDPVAYPGFDDAVKTSMQTELDQFLERVIFEDGGDARQLLTADHSQLDATLASYYGFGQADAASPKPDGWGTGILSLGGVLATHATFLATSPTQRGFMVRSKVMCETPPPPPIGIGDLPEPDDVSTTRERYEMHTAEPSCAGCHDQMDPIGFGFEGLDASGRFRQEENGQPIDNSGSVQGLEGEVVPFQGPVELAEALAGSDSISDCVTAQMASFAFGLDAHNTECIVDGPAAQMAAGEIGMVQAFVAFAGTRHFLHRN